MKLGSAYSIYFAASDSYYSGIKPDKTYGMLEFMSKEEAINECKKYGYKIGYISTY